MRCSQCGNSDCEHAKELTAIAAKQYAERTRLERAVIEAAKAEVEAETRREGDRGIDRLIATGKARRRAVIALLEFEQKQK